VVFLFAVSYPHPKDTTTAETSCGPNLGRQGRAGQNSLGTTAGIETPGVLFGLHRARSWLATPAFRDLALNTDAKAVEVALAARRP